MAIGALLVLDPAARPAADAVRSTLLERAAAVPRLGQRLARTPPGAGRPVWVEVGDQATDDEVAPAVAAEPVGEVEAVDQPRGVRERARR